MFDLRGTTWEIYKARWEYENWRQATNRLVNSRTGTIVIIEILPWAVKIKREWPHPRLLVKTYHVFFILLVSYRVNTKDNIAKEENKTGTFESWAREGAKSWRTYLRVNKIRENIGHQNHWVTEVKSVKNILFK